jgi:hypothetical protein
MASISHAGQGTFTPEVLSMPGTQRKKAPEGAFFI